MTKHNPGVNLEGLDFEAVDKEIEADEAAEAVVVALAEENYSRKKVMPPNLWLEMMLLKFFSFFLSFFLSFFFIFIFILFYFIFLWCPTLFWALYFKTST